MTGITKILVIGKFGEFATFVLEEVTSDLLQELKGKSLEEHPGSRKKGVDPKMIFAEYEKIKVAGVLRIYSPTTPGKRSPKMSLHPVYPE